MNLLEHHAATAGLNKACLQVSRAKVQVPCTVRTMKGLMAPAAGHGQCNEANKSTWVSPWGLCLPPENPTDFIHDCKPHLEPVNEAGTDAWSTAVARFTSGESGRAQMEVLQSITATSHTSKMDAVMADSNPHKGSRHLEKFSWWPCVSVLRQLESQNHVCNQDWGFSNLLIRAHKMGEANVAWAKHKTMSARHHEQAMPLPQGFGKDLRSGSWSWWEFENKQAAL